MSDSVYFIRPVGELGPIKIGSTSNLIARMASLSLLSPVELEIAAIAPGSSDLERRFHALFLPTRKRGEWFNWSPELGAVIDQISARTFNYSALPDPIYMLSPKREAARIQRIADVEAHRALKLAARLAAKEAPSPRIERIPRVPRYAPASFKDFALLGDVLAFCALHGIAESTFGRIAIGDPPLVSQLRQGRIARQVTSDRVRQFMATYQPETERAA
jgi:hypothetical protein